MQNGQSPGQVAAVPDMSLKQFQALGKAALQAESRDTGIHRLEFRSMVGDSMASQE